jgi:hypothetical protein
LVLPSKVANAAALRFRIELPPVELSENSITALTLALMIAFPAVESSRNAMSACNEPLVRSKIAEPVEEESWNTSSPPTVL